jgi:hypothetical protein
MAEHKLSLVEGGRAKEAKEVLDYFAAETLEVTKECGEMAGFVVVAWDAQGFPTTTFKLGKNNPLPQMMVPQLVKDILTTEMFQE